MKCQKKKIKGKRIKIKINRCPLGLVGVTKENQKKGIINQKRGIINQKRGIINQKKEIINQKGIKPFKNNILK